VWASAACRQSSNCHKRSFQFFLFHCSIHSLSCQPELALFWLACKIKCADFRFPPPSKGFRGRLAGPQTLPSVPACRRKCYELFCWPFANAWSLKCLAEFLQETLRMFRSYFQVPLGLWWNRVSYRGYQVRPCVIESIVIR